LGGMQLGELRVGNAKSHGRHVPHERLDACPVQELAGTDALSERLWQQSAQAAARARVDAHYPPRAADERQLDLVRADQPRTLDVDQLPIEEITLEQHLLGPALEPAEVELGLTKHDPVRADVRDPIDAQERRASGDVDEEARYRGIAGAAEAYDHVLDLSEPL